jgi:hypothetical protein
VPIGVITFALGAFYIAESRADSAVRRLGLLGITVVGAVLRTRQSASLRAGNGPVAAFVYGYHLGLWLTIALLAAGVLVSYVTLRPRGGQAVAAGETAAVSELSVVDELAAGELIAAEENS